MSAAPPARVDLFRIHGEAFPSAYRERFEVDLQYVRNPSFAREAVLTMPSRGC